jgi:phospholipase C
VGIDTSIEWGTAYERDHAIGLGYRVPLVIASPWSRGGNVNSQVFDHTSILMFLENWLSAKGKWVKETNLSEWRRTVCGDLTSTFSAYAGEPITVPRALDLGATVERIHAAQFQPLPTGGAPLARADIAAANLALLQEPGTRASCPLPYELVVNGAVHDGQLSLAMEARADAFGKASQGAPFNAYVYGDTMLSRAYAVRAGDVVHDTLPIASKYHVRVDGPNGFMREFVGTGSPVVSVLVDFAKPSTTSGVLEIRVANDSSDAHTCAVHDESYGAPVRNITIRGNERSTFRIDTSPVHGWYDFTISAGDQKYRYAGRVETGRWSISDPAMGHD